MSEITVWLAQHGGLLLMGSTALLLVGTLAVAVVRAPVYRQLLGEMSVAVTLIWLVLAAVPLPRWDLIGESDAPQHHSIAVTDDPAAVVSTPPPEDVSEVPFAVSGVVPVDSSPEPSDVDSSEPVPAAIASGSRSEKPQPFEVADKPAIVVPIDWPPIAAGAYLIGAGLCVGWLLLGRLVLAWRERAASEPDPWLVELYESLLPATNRRRARLLVSPRGRCPISYGLLRPRIVLPADLCRPEARRVLRHVLLHELAHVERRDARGHALLNLAFPVLFLHPLYWLLRRQVNFSRELIADDWAAGFDTPQSYAEGLIGWIRQHGSAPAAVSAGLGIIGASPFRNQFSRRMKMLIDRKKPLLARTSLRWTTASILAGTLVTVALAGVLGNSPADAQAKDETPTPTKQTPKVEPAPTTPADDPLPASDETPPTPAEPAGVNPGFGRVAVESSSFEKGKITLRSCAVELVHDVRLPATAEGVLVSLDVHEGSRVKQGQTLARLDDRQARLARDVALAGFETTRAELANNVNVRYSEASLKVAEQEYKRLEALARRNEVTMAEALRAKLAIKRSKLQVEQSQTDQKIIEVQLKVQKLRVAAAEADLSRYQVRALQDGIVVETHAKVGQWLKPGDPICRVVRLDRLRVVTSIPGEHYDPVLLDDKKITVVVKTRRGKRSLAAGRVFLAPLRVNGSHRLTVEVENRQENGRWVLQPTDRPTLLIEPAKGARPAN